MRKVLLILALVTSSAVSSEEIIETFFDGPTHFSNAETPNLQVKDWAVCAASYDIAATTNGLETAVGSQFANLANGAEVAIMFSQISGAILENSTVENYNSNVEYGKTLMESLPESALIAIMTQFELSDDKGATFKILANTLKVCMEHSALQQSYIDMYREMVTKGLLSVPSNNQ